MLVVLVVSVGMLRALRSNGKDKRSAATPPEVQLAVQSNVVRNLRNCADLLSLRDRVETNSEAGGRIYFLFARWLNFRNIMQAHDKSDGVMSQVAETVAMFHPGTVAKKGKLIQKLSKREDLCFMIMVLDRCYGNRGWSSVLKSAVGSEKYALTEELVEKVPDTDQNVDAQLHRIEAQLPESLRDHVTDKLAVSLLLKQNSQEDRQLVEVVDALLDTSGHNYETLRWLALCGTKVPTGIRSRIKHIATNRELGAGPRCPAIRAVGLTGKSVDFFSKLQNAPDWYPVSDVSAGSGIVQYYFQVVKQARVAYEFRNTPSAERLNYLVRARIKAPSPILTHISCAFYPVKMVQNILNRLREGKEPGGSMFHLSRVITDSGLMTEDLANSLISALEKMPPEDKEVVVEFMGSSGDFSRFAPPLIREYGKLEKANKPYHTLKSRIAANIMAMQNVGDDNTEVITLLKKLRDREEYRDYAGVISSIIKRIRLFRKIRRKQRGR